MKILHMLGVYKYTLLFFSIGLLIGCSQEQEISTEPVRIPLNDQVNRKAEVSYTHQKLKDGKGTKGEIRAVFEIKSRSEEGFIATWTTKSVKVGNILIDENSDQAGSLLLGVPFDFLTGSDGGPKKLLDKEKLLTDIRNSAAFAEADAKSLDKVINLYASMDEDTLANVLIKVPSFMSVCQDTNFVIGETNNFQTEQPSPFGEGVLLGNVSYELTSLDVKKNVANIKYSTEFDQESVKQLAIEAIDKLAPDAPILQNDIDELMVFRKDTAKCKVDMLTGWVIEIRYSTLIEASGETKEEIFDVSVNWQK